MSGAWSESIALGIWHSVYVDGDGKSWLVLRLAESGSHSVILKIRRPLPPQAIFQEELLKARDGLVETLRDIADGASRITPASIVASADN